MAANCETLVAIPETMAVDLADWLPCLLERLVRELAGQQLDEETCLMLDACERLCERLQLAFPYAAAIADVDASIAFGRPNGVTPEVPC